MVELKQCQQLTEVKEESLAALVSRLSGKNTSLAKRCVTDTSTETLNAMDDVNTRLARLTAIVAFAKAATSFDKKPSRKTAAGVTEKLHLMRSAGVTTDLCPACFFAHGILCSVFVSSCD